MAKVLLVEDDQAVSNVVADALRRDRHSVDAVFTASDSYDFLATYTYDILIIDWELPDGSGVDVCKKAKASKTAPPVLILTGKRELDEKITGLDSGADDYLTKPFSVEELLARLRALLRRTSHDDGGAASCEFADIVIDRASCIAKVMAATIKLTPREFRLLEYFMNNAGRVIGHDELRTQVWWDEADLERNTINAGVARLRNKLAKAGSSVNLIALPREGFELKER